METSAAKPAATGGTAKPAAATAEKGKDNAKK